MRKTPNILIIGAPGIGKSKLCDALIQSGLKLEWFDIDQFFKQFHCNTGNELEEFNIQCEPKLLETLDSSMEEGGKIVDSNIFYLFPISWFDKIFVLKADDKILYDRLKKRGYSRRKIENIMKSDVFKKLYERAKESCVDEYIHEVRNETFADMDSIINLIRAWMEQWIGDNIRK